MVSDCGMQDGGGDGKGGSQEEKERVSEECAQRVLLGMHPARHNRLRALDPHSRLLRPLTTGTVVKRLVREGKSHGRHCGPPQRRRAVQVARHVERLLPCPLVFIFRKLAAGVEVSSIALVRIADRRSHRVDAADAVPVLCVKCMRARCGGAQTTLNPVKTLNPKPSKT
jgi:hypothetical protein